MGSMKKKFVKATAEKTQVSFDENGGKIESISQSIRSLEDLLLATNVDLAFWEVTSQKVNAYEAQGADGPVTLFQVNAHIRPRKNAAETFNLLEEFEKRSEEYAPKLKFPPLAKNRGKNLLEISVPDLHLAKLAWGKETGHGDYDINIAKKMYREAVMGLYNRVKDKTARVLLPIGNDFFNSDNHNGTTTKGTPQAANEDSRWPKVFAEGCDMLVSVIEEIAHDVPVDVVIVAGNHDKERCFYLGQYLRAWFRNTDRVTVNSSPQQRKYYRYGNTLIGFTHGNEEKPDKLPLIMASEQKEAWSKTKFHHWHLGHLHHEITRDYNGVVVRFLTSLCPPDEWHASKGYIGNVQAAEAFLYNEESGLLTVEYYTI